MKPVIDKERSITQFHAEFVEKERLERKAKEIARIEAEEKEREEQARIWWER